MSYFTRIIDVNVSWLEFIRNDFFFVCGFYRYVNVGESLTNFKLSRMALFCLRVIRGVYTSINSTKMKFIPVITNSIGFLYVGQYFFVPALLLHALPSRLFQSSSSKHRVKPRQKLEFKNIIRGVVKEKFSVIVLGYFFFSFLLKNICCRNSLEASRRVPKTYVFVLKKIETITPELSLNTPP